MSKWSSAGEKNRENHKIPLTEKESYKWLMSYNKGQEIAALTPNTRIITVTDREGDLYDLYHEAYISPHKNSFWLIKAKTNRRLLDSDNNLQDMKLIEAVKTTNPVGFIDFELPTRDKNNKRLVKQAIHVAKVRLSPPDRRHRKTRYQIVETNVDSNSG